MKELYKTWAEISLDALEYNYKSILQLLKEDTNVIAVIKADAYGHGAIQVAKLFDKLGTKFFAVSSLDEAIQLRKAGLNQKILILGWTPPKYAHSLASYHISQAVSSFEEANELQSELCCDDMLNIHLAINTGMGRIGFEPNDESIEEICKINDLKSLVIEGIFTHFAVADVPSNRFTDEQYNLFTSMISKCEAKGINLTYKHCANSGAIIDYADMHLNTVRPGIILYGLVPDRETKPCSLKPVMSLKSLVSNVKVYQKGKTIGYGRTYTCEKETKVAVIPVGYADGLMRTLSGKICFKIGNHIVHQIGRICMDMCMVDISNTDIKVGDVAEIFGNWQSATDVADLAGTISYEVVSQISKRVPRVYIYHNEEVESFSYLQNNEKNWYLD